MNLYRTIVVAWLAIAVSACAVIRGEQPAGEYASDAAISASIKSKLAIDRNAPAMSVNVDTKDGQVLLTGTAATQAEKDRIGQVARDTRGVKAVRNEVIVRSQ
jgi:hyperosmotically inducible periplasmic protein